MASPRDRAAGDGRGNHVRWLAVGAAFVGLVLALNVTPITNNDIFLHLRTGAVVLETHHVPRIEDYSALARGRPFIAHEWLAGVIFRLVQMGGGFDALILFKCAVALALSWVLYRAARWSGAAPGVAVACLGFTMILAAARLLERPHIFAWLLLGLDLLVLTRRRARRLAGLPGGGLGLLALLQVLWANLHGSFLLGPALVLLAAAAEVIEGLRLTPWDARQDEVGGDRTREAGRLTGCAAALVLASAVNPYGFALLRFPFELMGSEFMRLVYEWQPPYSGQFRTTYMALYYLVWALLGLGVLGTAAIRSRRAGVPPGGVFPFLVFGAFLVLSLRMNRNVTDFALATVPGVAGLLTWVLPRGRRAPPEIAGARPAAGPDWVKPVWLAAALGVLAAWFAVAGYAYSPSGKRRPGLGLGRSIPVAAADYLERNGITGDCLNTYSAGAYLIYRFYPRVRVGMDSRNDVYGLGLYTDYVRALTSADGLHEMLVRLDARFAFIEWTQPQAFATPGLLRHTEGGWRPVYFDDVATIYLPAGGPYAGIAARDGYQVLDPALFRPGTWSLPEAGTALAESGRASSAADGSYMARVMRVEALTVLGRRQEADIEEARLVAEDPPLAHIHALLGLIHLVRGERDRAVPRLRRALAINPYLGDVRAALASISPGR